MLFKSLIVHIENKLREIEQLGGTCIQEQEYERGTTGPKAGLSRHSNSFKGSEQKLLTKANQM